MEYPTTNGVTQYPTSAARLEVLDRVAKSQYLKDTKLLTILEIGSLYGDSARVLVKYGKVMCIDTWDWPNGLETFRANTHGLDIEYCQGKSSDILPSFVNHMFDLIYIDGCHVYPTVETDMWRAKQLIKPGGIICGDDLERVITTRDDMFHATANKCTDYIEGYHPGVSLAVWTFFDSAKVNMENGFWWVQC